MEKPFATVIKTARTKLLYYAERPQQEEPLKTCLYMCSSTTARLLLGLKTTDSTGWPCFPGMFGQVLPPTSTAIPKATAEPAILP